MELGFWSSYIFGDFTRHEIESFFIGISKEFNILEHQAKTTQSLYQKEHQYSKDNIEKSFALSLEAANARYNELLKAAADSEEDAQWAHYESGLGQLEDQHQWELTQLNSRLNSLHNLLYRSMVIIAYSLLESEMSKLCTILKVHFNKRISVGDLSQSNYIAAARKYFELVIELEQAELEPFNGKLGHLQSVRNKLIHENGLVNEKAKKEILGATNTFEGVSLEPEGDKFRIMLSFTFISQVIACIREYFFQLFLLIDRREDHVFLKERARQIVGFASTAVDFGEVELEYTSSKKTFTFRIADVCFENKAVFNLDIVMKSATADGVTIVVDKELTGHEEVHKLQSSFDNWPAGLKDLLKCFLPDGLWQFKMTFSLP